MREQKPDRLWAIATGVNKRTERRYFFPETIRTTRRGAVAAFDGNTPGELKWYRKHFGYRAVRVLVTIEDAAPRGATQEEEGE